MTKDTNIDLNDLVSCNPQAHDFLSLGFPLPLLHDPIQSTGTTILGDIGARIAGPADRGNLVIYESGLSDLDLTIQFSGHDNVVVIGRDCNLKYGSRLILESEGGLALFCGGPEATKAYITLRGKSPLVYYGPNSTANEISILAHGAMAAIGPDALLSWGITMRTFDSHAIIDLDTMKQLNEPKNIIIHKHVWIGQDVIIMPGVTVGKGAIIGACSVVTRSIPAETIAAGSPAKVIRERVSWTREPHPSASDISRASASLAS